MRISSFALELGEWRVEQEREANIARVRDALRHAGSIECDDCGEVIDDARRVAVPSAHRCISCQTKHEKATWRRG